MFQTQFLNRQRTEIPMQSSPSCLSLILLIFLREKEYQKERINDDD